MYSVNDTNVKNYVTFSTYENLHAKEVPWKLVSI